MLRLKKGTEEDQMRFRAREDSRGIGKELKLKK